MRYILTPVVSAACETTGTAANKLQLIAAAITTDNSFFFFIFSSLVLFKCPVSRANREFHYIYCQPSRMPLLLTPKTQKKHRDLRCLISLTLLSPSGVMSLIGRLHPYGYLIKKWCGTRISPLPVHTFVAIIIHPSLLGIKDIPFPVRGDNVFTPLQEPYSLPSPFH